MNIKIRNAKKQDSKEIIKLIKELAIFEKLEPPNKSACVRLLNDAFCKKPLFNILVAENEGKLIGYTFYFFTYSTFLARQTLYLEDIYISKSFRSLGIGKVFLDKLVDIAKAKKCGRMEWVVLDWNIKAINFYKKLGAKNLNNWKYFRLTF